MGGLEQRVEVRELSEQRVNVRIVGHVVAKIRHRRCEDWRNPDGIHAQLYEVRQPLRNAAQVTDPVPVGVLKGAWIDLINNARLPPACHRMCQVTSAWFNRGPLHITVTLRSGSTPGVHVYLPPVVAGSADHAFVFRSYLYPG